MNERLSHLLKLGKYKKTTNKGAVYLDHKKILELNRYCLLVPQLAITLLYLWPTALRTECISVFGCQRRFNIHVRFTVHPYLCEVIPPISI